MAIAEDLTTNFRTVAPILDWVNAVFGNLITYQDGAQPDYVALGCARLDVGTGAAVTVLGAEPHQDAPLVDALREREAADVAASSVRSSTRAGPVFDEGTGGWRPARRETSQCSSRRTSLPFLEDALDGAGVPYRAEASSLVYQAEEVRSLLAGARAVADTSDSLSLVTALRSPLFGCGDDDLWRWKQAGGRFGPAEVDGPLSNGPVGSALDYLRRLSFEARWLTPSEVLAALVSDRRMFEVGATGPRGARFVASTALCRRPGPGLVGGVTRRASGLPGWAGRQGQEVSRVAEAVLPETDADAVRVMTIHAAKGLEFPIVVVSGMTSHPNHAGRRRAALDAGRRLRRQVQEEPADHRLRGRGARRRADGRPTRSYGCSTWRRHGHATTSSYRCTARSRPSTLRPRRSPTPAARRLPVRRDSTGSPTSPRSPRKQEVSRAGAGVRAVAGWYRGSSWCQPGQAPRPWRVRAGGHGASGRPRRRR